MPDGTLQILGLGTSAVPLDYQFSGSQTAEFIALKADFDGSAAAVGWVPVVEILSDAGHVMAQSKGPTVLAGGSATVTFFPSGADDSSGGVTPGALANAKVYSAVTQSVPHNPIPSTPMTFDSVESDPHGFFSLAAPTRLTIPAGFGGAPYLVTGGTFTADNPVSDCIISFTKNTNSARGGAHTGPHVTTGFGQPIGYFPAGSYLDPLGSDGDYYQMRMYVDNGGNPMTFGNAVAVDAQTWMCAIRLGV